jgi:MFS family permease
MSALVLAEITGSFETAMIYAALNKMIAAFGDPIAVGWLVTSYMLVGAGSAAIAGRLGDIYGRRRLALILLAVGIIGSIVSASSGLFALVLVGRLLQGVTGAILPLCVGLARERLPIDKVSVGVGFMMGGASAGAALGLVCGGLIVDHFSWRGIFVASALLSVLSFAAIVAWVPRAPTAPRTGRLDWLGGVLFVPPIAGILLFISNGRVWGWGDGRSLTVLGASIVLLVLWVRKALRTTDPLIDVRLFRNRRVLVPNVVAALFCAGGLQHTMIFSMMLQAPVWTGVGLGVSATFAGLVKLPSNVSSTFAGPFSGWVTTRISGRTVMALGGLFTAGAWMTAMVFHASPLQIVLVLILISFGGTLMFTVGPNVVVEAVPADRVSEAIGMMTVIRQTFLGVGAQLMAVLLATHTVKATDGSGTGCPTEDAFLLAMSVVVVLTVMAALSALALPRRSGPSRKERKAVSVAEPV